MRSESIRSAKSKSTSDGGFTLVEVVIAMMLLSMVALGVAQLFGIAIQRNMAARYQTSTTVLAGQKLEQLRALTLGFDAASGLPVTDMSTNLTTEPPTSGGGGLNPSPSNSLSQNTPGYVDYLDSRGNLLGTGAAPPATALYIRRWNISPLPTNPNNTLILQVLVTTVNRDRQTPATGARRRAADEALVATLKTRKAK
ncbi:MAG TPA: prepilin-type N-terminal cleavage/methylation domain-containing protein [Vicinamibacterales bacterium]|nr:prepilin-type N-terminal cleavage/methylation domain-containing protein [Vicinamibacterales bacterium]